ncbi:MAG: ThuA domain-containing protein [Halioglobus sp.]|nr:ThuA domain-containing protein [Halioglobus sp.]
MPSKIPTFTRPAVLVFNKTNGFRHEEAIPAADRVFSELAAENGWDVFVTDSADVHDPDSLARFQLVVWNNVSGDVLTLEQRESLQQWLESGGGWLGVHGSGGDLSYDWGWYVDTLIGTQFHGHTLDPQFQDAELVVMDASEPLTEHLGPRWRVPNEEWYAFASNPRDRGCEILLTIDKSSYITRGEISPGWTDDMTGEHPQAWRHCQGKGRVFYSAIGHNPETYVLPEYRQLLGKAMRWAISDC